MSTSASVGTLDSFLREQLDVLITVRDNMPLLRRIALQYVNVEEVDDFAVQVNALYAVLGTLMDASELILQASEAGINMLIAEDVAAQRALLGLGTAALVDVSAFPSAAAFAALQAQVNQIAANISGLLTGMGNYASQAALNALIARVVALEEDAALQDQINQLILNLTNGFYNASLLARIVALEAAVALLQAGNPLTGIINQLAAINNLLIQITVRQDGSDNAYTSLAFRVTQTELANEASISIQVELTARLSIAEGAIIGQSTALQELAVRTTSTEAGLLSESTARTLLQSQLINNITLTEANSLALQTLQTTVSTLNGTTQATSAAVVTLASRVTNAESGLIAAALATTSLSTRVTVAESGIEVLSSDYLSLQASLTSPGNLLSNPAFEADLRGWEIFSRGVGWLTNELIHNLNPSLLPRGVGTMALEDAGTPSGEIGVRTSERSPIVGRQRYIVSGYLAAQNCKAQLFWRLFNAAGQEIDFGLVGETTVGPTTNLDTCVRVYDVVPAPIDAVEIQLQWWVVDCTGFPVKAWLFRPMLEAAAPQQVLPSPWAPGSSGSDKALATAVVEVNARILETEDLIEVHTAQITTLGSQLTLKPVVYVSAEPPTGGTYRIGDLWFDSNDSNKQYLWDGTTWVPSSSNAEGIQVFVQDEPPVAGMLVGDLWVDSNDGNKLYRWNGTVWADISDARIAATATAVTSLGTRVTATENSITTQSGQLTDLSSEIADTQSDLAAVSAANTSLYTQVQSIAGSKVSVFTSPTTPEGTSYTAGDIWIDTDDGNRISVWNGTVWVLRADTNGIKIFSQPTSPVNTGRPAGDLWFDSDDTNRQYRWDGTGWLDVTDSRITSQAGQITTLQSQVAQLPAVYVQSTTPTGGTYNVGDIWFDSDDANKQYIWNGTLWADTASVSGSVNYAQTAEPTGGSYNIGDLWIDLDDSNRLYRWNGAAWIDIADQRIAANAAATTALTTRVTAAEGNITTQSGQITTLNNDLAGKASAGAVTALTTRVDSVETTRPRVYAQASEPGVIGRVTGDLWIDTFGGLNRTYVWNGAWTLRTLGPRVFVQTNQPSSGQGGDLWFDSDDGHRQWRFNGTGAVWEDVSDARITTQASLITTLQSQLGSKNRVFAQATQPTATAVGDSWIDTDESNKFYVWDGATWVYRPMASGNRTFVGTTAPSGEVYTLNDLWFDSDDGNKQYYWNGSAWALMPDGATTANATAISGLTSRVNSVNGAGKTIEALATDVTNLTATVDSKANSTAVANLTAEVTKKSTSVVGSVTPAAEFQVLGNVWIDTGNGNIIKAWNGSTWGPYGYSDPSKNKTTSSATAPVGPITGDLWIDTGNNNTLKTWSGSAWVAHTYSDPAKNKTTASGTAPTSPATGDLWIDTANANLLKVWSGAAWTAYAYSDPGKNKTTSGSTAPVSPITGDLWVDTGNGNMLKRWSGSAWVDMTDTRTVSSASSIVTLNSQIAGKAEATAVTALTTRVATAEGYFGVNLYPNAAMAFDAKGWNDIVASSAGDTAWVHSRNYFSSPTGVNNYSFWHPGTPANNSTFNVSGDMFPLSPNTTYIVSGSVALYNLANAGFRIELFDRNGTYLGIGGTFSTSSTSYTGGSNRAAWLPGSISCTTGATVRFGRIVMLATSNGTFQPQYQFMEPMVERASAGQSVPTAFNTGPLTAWAEWEMTLGVNGYVSGIRFGNDGRTSVFKVRASQFEVADPSGTDMLSWQAGVITARKGANSVKIGAGFGADATKLILYYGANVADESATFANAKVGITAGGKTKLQGLQVNFGSGWLTGGALTTFSGNDTSVTVSVASGTFRIGDESIAYGASSVSVPGSAGQTKKVYVYYIDAAREGGTRTLYYSESRDATFTNIDYILVGEATFTYPASGGSTSGSGGGGGRDCVEWDTVLPDGRYVRDLVVGDLVECVDVVTGERGMFPLLAMSYGEEFCYRVQAGNASVIQSESTPMNMPDGSVVRTADLAGSPVLTYTGTFEPARIHRMGKRLVCKPDLGDRMFFAGETAETTLATHNIQYKP